MTGVYLPAISILLNKNICNVTNIAINKTSVNKFLLIIVYRGIRELS